jgi:hypothetical protein
VKQGLKYNFEKSSRVFLQNYGVLEFSRIFGIILLKKNLWNRFRAAWTGSMGPALGFMV